jgi:hypothetical protein
MQPVFIALPILQANLFSSIIPNPDEIPLNIIYDFSPAGIKI